MADAAAAPEPEPFLVLEGELKKSSGGKHTVGKVKSTLNTKRRYFVLTEDGRLRYFKSQKEFQARPPPQNSKVNNPLSRLSLCCAHS